ncbi:MAG TPA: ABC transporter ATP-binding protein [Kofleriaceae bacterium]|nr:ABC transporter ATP-binding protein [Kofleriaceae bacterium]
MPIDSLSAAGVSKRYGNHRALAAVDLTVRAGRLCALLGPNGAGKSTLLGILSTLVRPSDGAVHYRSGGADAAPGPELRRHIGVLAHDAFVYGELSGRENLLFWARLYGVAEPERRAAEMIAAVGLDAKAVERPARTYSRGMTQRLALARALLHDPQILLLDEPFTGLDRGASDALGRTLGTARAGGKIIVVVTHDLEAIGDVTDDVVVLARGKVAHQEQAERPLSGAALRELYQRFTAP